IGSPQAYGLALGKAIFADAVLGKTYGETLAVCQGRGDGLRVRLLLEAEDLQGIPWERLHQQLDGEWLPLGSTAVTPFSRFVPPQQWARPQPVVQRPLRILLVIASPADLERAKLDPILEPERKKLRDLFTLLPDVSVTILESGTSAPPTLDEIRKSLAEGYHIVHFLCHGVKTNAGTALFLEKPGGMVDVVTTQRLVNAVKALQSPPVFCFLTACESAARARSDGFLPIGPALVEDGGVQAVIAMTSRVGIELASQFTSQFYTRLLKHGVLDLAVNEARALVQDQWDWGVPVLFSRLVDNQLLDFPIGRIYDDFLIHNDRAFAAVDEAIAAARLEDHGQELVTNLLELVDELRKSHGALVTIASKFRRTGQDPQSFSKDFQDFYYLFKEYY
ncbi:MAG: CHAT domain-containing protein, partial [Anaerolineaceae bacterium]|nr:CHAT domain-containing protein [Anaerolineaceae bacterium]